MNILNQNILIFFICLSCLFSLSSKTKTNTIIHLLIIQSLILILIGLSTNNAHAFITIFIGIILFLMTILLSIFNNKIAFVENVKMKSSKKYFVKYFVIILCFIISLFTLIFVVKNTNNAKKIIKNSQAIFVKNIETQEKENYISFSEKITPQDRSIKSKISLDEWLENIASQYSIADYKNKNLSNKNLSENFLLKNFSLLILFLITITVLKSFILKNKTRY